jgi:hypothetical protein
MSMHNPLDEDAFPGEDTTLIEVLSLYSDGGFPGIFSVTPDGGVECGSCGVESEAAVVSMHSLRRLEGASDPDDMLAVAAVSCPSCGSRGTVTMMFGPMASPEEAMVMGSLRDCRDDELAPPNSAPDEMTDSRLPD